MCQNSCGSIGVCGSVVYVEQAPPCAAQLVPVIPVYIMGVFRDLDSLFDQSGESSTGRTVEDRRREHIRYCKLHQVDKSAIAQHSAETGHAVDFDKIDVLGREDRRLPRLIKEAIQIAKHPHNINRDDGYQLSSAWRSLLDVHHRATHPDTAATEDRGDIFIPLPPP
ncbi:hypothetical protein C0J52_20802 [Blattella germanica]|nr:hypothetical protein C0J52_20802 [Blattella germanica]